MSWSPELAPEVPPQYWNPAVSLGSHSIPISSAATISGSAFGSVATECDESNSEGGKKKRRRIPPEAKQLLEETFERIRDDPYAPQAEIKNLAKLTGLSVRQVRTFFANARARKLPPSSDLKPPGVSQPKQIANTHETIAGQPDPMERFLSSSPEDEGISEEVIRRAAAICSSNTNPPSLRRHSSKPDGSDVGSNSAGSESSRASIDSANNRGPRRGRKRRREQTDDTNTLLRKPGDPHKIYQCTFCAKDFAQKYDWRRHEESVHFPQQEWICMPDGLAYVADQTRYCVFCDEMDPDEHHAAAHHCSTCLAAPRSKRTFLRKDKLLQHLIQVHRMGQFSKTTQTWCRPVERAVDLICGFCGLVLSDWPSRIEHIAAHFIDGITMLFWLLRPGGMKPHGTEAGALASSDIEAKCPRCSDQFGSETEMIFHKRQIHNVYRPRVRDLALPEQPSYNTIAQSTDEGSSILATSKESSPKRPMFVAPPWAQLDNLNVQDNDSSSSVTEPLPPPKETIEQSTTIKMSSQTLGPNPHGNWITGNIHKVASQSLVSNPHAVWNRKIPISPRPPSSVDPQLMSMRRHRTRSSLSNVLTPIQSTFPTMRNLASPLDFMDAIDMPPANETHSQQSSPVRGFGAPAALFAQGTEPATGSMGDLTGFPNTVELGMGALLDQARSDDGK
ncbi:hypothetical protein EJ04DRAFT_152763 [Polyplosphaeria fusca]|uniref:Uncharacterized protein n=1 Tax=Polyplosphaeria fusca TaxID=682080 RepID=A0A9P4UWC2_9PLEO|nr:hypothetical protein EJ04DRAFT_152763 [Polyplosphaeria fusca]